MTVLQETLSIVGRCLKDPLVCHCYHVTESTIRDAIDRLEATSVEAVRQRTLAGSGCTACQCRIRRMLAGLPAQCSPLDLCSQCGFGQAACECKVA